MAAAEGRQLARFQPPRSLGTGNPARQVRLHTPPEKPFEGFTVVLVGTGSLAKALATRIQHGGGTILFACDSVEMGEMLADTYSCKVIDPGALAGTAHDCLILCDNLDMTGTRLRPKSIVMDLNARILNSPFLRHAEKQNCRILAPRDLFLDEIARQAKLLTGKEPNKEHLAQVYDNQEVDTIQ